MRPLPALAALLAATTVLLVPARAQESAPADGLEHFERRVRPVLVERCYECHSSRARRLKGGLSLESREGWVRGGLSGAAVVPGDPDASLVVQAVRYTDEELQMPPAGRLPAAEVAALEEWVRGGAPDPRVEGASKEPVPPATIDMEAARAHWAFRPMAAGKPPRVRDES